MYDKREELSLYQKSSHEIKCWSDGIWNYEIWKLKLTELQQYEYNFLVNCRGDIANFRLYGYQWQK